MDNREVIYTQEQLEDRLSYWQRRLRLQDWRLTVELCRMRDISDNQARIYYERSHKAGRIWIGDLTDYNPADKTALDMEWNLVHELLHLHFDAIDTHSEGERPKIVQQELEAAIDSIAQALVTLERRADELAEYYEDELAQRRPPLMLPGVMHVRYASGHEGG
jgi:hypothetical protein